MSSTECQGGPTCSRVHQFALHRHELVISYTINESKIMATITNLPNELLLQIAGHLQHDARSLAQLRSVSRRFNDIAAKVLYGEVDLIVCHSPIYLFVRTLIDRPDLARSITSLRCKLDTDWKDGDDEASWAVHFSGLELVGKCVPHLLKMHRTVLTNFRSPMLISTLISLGW
jgi:hypothetical protein